MDDDSRTYSACSADDGAYRCPGQTYTIDRAAHLARLAAFYPACLDCAHRHDAIALSSVERRAWSQLEARPKRGLRPSGESLAATACGDLDAPAAARVATALAHFVWRSLANDAASPAVLVGSDGSSASADCVSAACRALTLAGCTSLELGAVSAPCLVTATQQLAAAAAMWIGNASGLPHAMDIKLWGHGGQPWSSPGELDPLWTAYGQSWPRAKRGGGSVRRHDAQTDYFAALADLSHGLRPLAIVLDTSCEPVVESWRKLTAATACRLLRPRGEHASGAFGRLPFVARRLARLAGEVTAAGGHFGAWVSGDGETCRLVDERGQAVDGRALWRLLANFVGAGGEAAAVLAAATRQQAHQQLVVAGARLGIDADGRHWYAGPPVVCDALVTLSLLAQCLSQSDRGLSEVLDAARDAG